MAANLNHREPFRMATSPPPASASDGRNRLSIELSAPVASLLDHVSETLGLAKSQLVVQALLDALPELGERADQLRKRHESRVQGKRK